MLCRLITSVLTFALTLFVLASPGQTAPEYTLTLNLPIPPMHTRWTGPLKAWVEEIEKKSAGRIKIEPYFAETLSPRSEAFESVKSGLADITECAYEANFGQFPFHEGVCSILSPGVCIENPAPILKELYLKFPQVLDEVQGVKFIFTHVSPVLMIGTKDKQIRSLDDLRGMKINANSAMISERLKSIGVSVVSMPMSDIFTALEQGVIDGTTLDYELLVSRRFGDSIKYMAQISMQNTLFYCVMNEDKFNELPPDLQKVILDASGDFADKAFGQYWSTIEDESLTTWVKTMGGTEVTLLSDADYTQARQKMQPVVDAWFTSLNKHDLPGTEIRKTYYELEAKYGTPWKDFPRYQLFKSLKK